MSFQRKSPPIRIILTKDEFNLLLELITENENTYTNNLNTVKLKNKLLKFSRPYVSNNNEYAQIGLFSQECTELIKQFLIFVKSKNSLSFEIDYYNVIHRLKELSKEE